MLADLDINHCNYLVHLLFKLNGQIFVTGTDREKLLNIWKKVDIDTALFHVKQGNIERVY